MQGIPPIDQISPAAKAAAPTEIESVAAASPADTNAFRSAVAHTNFSSMQQTQSSTNAPVAVQQTQAAKTLKPDWLRTASVAKSQSSQAGRRVLGDISSNAVAGQKRSANASWDSMPSSSAGTPSSVSYAAAPAKRSRMLSEISSNLDNIQKGMNSAQKAGTAENGSPSHDDLLDRYAEIENFTIRANVAVTGTNGLTHSTNNLLKGQ